MTAITTPKLGAATDSFLRFALTRRRDVQRIDGHRGYPAGGLARRDSGTS